MLAWAILQGHDPLVLLGRSPVLDTLFDRLATTEPTTQDRVKVADAVAMNLGWQLFGLFISRAAGLDLHPAHNADLERQQRIKRLVRRPPPT
jgi:hypothetical protein